MKCQKCQSERVANVCAKCSDCCSWSIGDKEHDGYVPKDIGIGDMYGDYVAFDYCLDCGQIQGTFPLPLTSIEKGEEE